MTKHNLRLGNSTLAKINKLNLLKTLVNQVLISKAVFQEVVIEGKRLAENDAYRVEKAINPGWLKVKEGKNFTFF